jgi:hypothetical protein
VIPREDVARPAPEVATPPAVSVIPLERPSGTERAPRTDGATSTLGSGSMAPTATGSANAPAPAAEPPTVRSSETTD